MVYRFDITEATDHTDTQYIGSSVRANHEIHLKNALSSF